MRFEEYRAQLPSLKHSLQDCDKVKNLHYNPLKSTIHIHIQWDVTEFNISHLECKITYSQTYHEPQLLLRIWKFSQIEGIDCIEPWFPKQIDRILPLPNWFQFGLDTISTSSSDNPAAWYSIHACDTADIVGDRSIFQSTYLSRWASVFLFDWIQNVD
ncbi:hypothetical protein ZYGR_0AD00810 [Zygosaccharomyces rouxii]|uniref:ZYRO0G07766p n=2 Tax=Zygosaccharomyces rouxii TaxID=4956 RepID=C5DZW5_ZYGRC|nr:uncharacterized protein ZYRO0G07766g [Zygosaccharomyces rouxii]GAV50898.1 hypothetical protein ZYGR_0AD00810 [Zygosaccharomyces rouxii]CAR29399.1 ZYRO0G07766p [Zygosaccharomyces rouxii]